MCGLVGIMSSNMLMKHKDMLKDLLYLDTWRGRDSTGVATLRHNADTEIMKSTIPGYEFVEGNKLENFLRLNDFLWIGHNRFGTVGKNIKTNAHPFQILDEDGGCLVVGAHNGTLKNKHALTDHAQFGTDSEALFNEIALNGVNEALGKVEGAWALTYYDHVHEEFRMIRNKERPLFYAWSKDKKTLIWASEMWMIRIVTQRHGFDLLEDKIYATIEDTLYKIPAPMKMNEELVMQREGGVVGKQPAPFFQGYRQGWTGGPTGHKTAEEIRKEVANLPAVSSLGKSSQAESGTLQLPSNPKPSDLPRPDGKVVPIDGKKYKGWKGEVLTLKQLKDQLSEGCAWCETEFPQPDEPFAWLAKDKPVCHLCLTGGHEEKAIKTYSIN